MASSSGSQFRGTVWDPVLIIAQMLALQSFYYVFFTLFVLFAALVTGSELSLGLVFDARGQRGDTLLAWLVVLGQLCAAALGCALFIFATFFGLTGWLSRSMSLVLIVERSKQCADFTVTLHMFHLLACTIRSGFPTTLLWWSMNLGSVLIMAFLGEFICLQKEMVPISLSGKSLNQA